ncbi:acyltransferase [Citrobacter sp. MNAZ 1397]|uniref:acyltransferase family protein n=1 Tax=Citrobacter sp. MNAZ 1397 TaxID=2911205 RepID=UPI00202616E4|nr:acyltransferase [Citrobacter sp. MNAZ 1397]MCL9671491.1 acyltransferase [Citrobacter sp. MNAZ 1397]
MRYQSLDLVRGYAALTVVIAHTTIAGLYNNPNIWPFILWTPLRFLWAGHQAVIVFFVLSGFALTKMIDSCLNYNYTRFLAARIIRLFIPCILSIFFVFTIFGCLKKFGFTWEQGWNGVVNPTFNLKELLPHFGLIGSYNYYSVNPPLWSLVYEARISIFFPLIFLIIKKFRFYGILFFTLLSLLCIYGLYKSPQSTGYDYFGTTMLTGHYSLFFAMGCILSFHIEKIKTILMSISAKMQLLLFIISILVYCYPFNNPWTLAQRGIGDIVTSFGAIGLLIVSTALKESGWFFKLGVFLGKISFSLYLTHFTVLSMALITLLPKFGAIAVWAYTIPVSIILAYFFTIIIDKPSVKLSRIVYKRTC